VLNLTAAFSLRPEYMPAREALLGAIRGNVDLRRYELVTLAAARALRSSYCMLAHGSVLLREFFGEDELRAIVDAASSASISTHWAPRLTPAMPPCRLSSAGPLRPPPRNSDARHFA
jgi:Carboxymuconolactone decarboxylase family